MRYDAHEILVGPARATAHPGRLVAGIALGVPVFVALSYGYAALLPLLFGPEAWAQISPGIESASNPQGVLINLFVFGLLIVALGLTLRIVHRRGLSSIIGPHALALRQFTRAMGVMLLLYGALLFLPMPEGLEPVANLPASQWLMLLPLALTGLFLQVFAEELVFRGYLQSQLAARFASPLVWMVLPSVSFAMLHYDPISFGANAWVVVAWAAAFGLAAADLTARSGTLGPATALHFINNFSAIMIAAPRGQFDGLALYAYPFTVDNADALWAMMPLDLLILICGWLAIRLSLRR
ncbi:CAAX protease self-immunity [Roseovarius mucosus DSM 17069]|uniref:CAAX protease self-immunity n=1 Tax=Roseovarius mucosus DSM 17069 TaxID=1288298 RepID=A0A0A0HMF0_9RHOB|nr:CPBP family intramembrane glutamic endopeptidase [Roseovarius mucosus]KGM88992.1 CAAX protease self-immunity [Roseovarius mucosus DSM 17069]